MGGFDPAAPFASVDDLEAAWRPLDDGERVAGMEGLCLLWDAVAAGGVPPVGGALWLSHEVTLAPCQYDLQDDGTATYQMAGEITWRERG